MADTSVDRPAGGTLAAVPADRVRELVGNLTADRPPLYAALAARLRLLVGDGRLPVGARLPAERDLAAALHCSRATVAAGYGLLREQGWLAARQGSGTWTTLPARPGPAGGVPGRPGPAGAWVPGPTEPGVLDLAHAAPSAPPQVAAAFAAALTDLPGLLPGHGYHPYGLPELRERIAARYTARGLPTTPEQVLVTAGGLHGVSVAVAALVPRGGRVLVEHPTYPNALDAIAARGRPVPVAVPDDPAGLVRDLTRAARQTRPAAAYLMPDFQNPTGLQLDEPLRRRLASGLAQLGVVAVVDETLAELALDGAPSPPFAAVSRPGLVVHAGSLSKSVWGGLRVGWLRAEPDVVRRAAAETAHATMSMPVVEQLAAARLLDVLDGVLAERRAALRAQRDALVAAVRRQLPDWTVPVPAGGLVLWCGLPGLSSTALARAAGERGLLLAAGPRFGTGHAFDDRLRLPFTQPVPVLERAVGLLAEAAADLPAPRRRPRREREVAVDLVV